MFSLPRRQSTSALPSPSLSVQVTSTPTSASGSHKLSSEASPGIRPPLTTAAGFDEEGATAMSRSNGNDEGSHCGPVLRSPKVLHPESHSEQLQRSLSRDFSLSIDSTSEISHESCSSLKDQFLRIKERFSSPSPPKPPTPASTPSTSRADTDTVSAVVQPAQASATHGKENVIPEPICRKEMQRKQAKDAPISDGQVVDGEADSKKQQTRVERWYMEDSYFKGVITCWTIEKGASIVARIASIAGDGSVPAGTDNIKPDVSLQWIGRQVWAVTVSLPLPRAGELTQEHIALAHRIDKAIAVDDGDPDSTIIPGNGNDTSSTTEVDSDEQGESKTPSPQATTTSTITVCEESEDKDKISPDTLSSAVKTTAGRDHSPGSVSAAEDDASFPPNEGDNRKSEGQSGRHGRANSATGATPDCVAPLPLSWSMLSLSSLHSSSDNIRNSTTGSTGTCESRDEDFSMPRFATPNKMGWLKKKSGLNSWQSRYFELKGNRLYYFANEKDGIPRGAIVLEHAHVVRGKGDQAMAFSISSSSALHTLQTIKFTSRLTHQMHPRKSIVLRVVDESDRAVSEWVTALNRASFYSNLAATSPSPSSSFVYQSRAFPSPSRKRKTAFSRFRSPSASSVPSIEEEEQAINPIQDGMPFHHLGSVKYLQETDPLLWEINPSDQLAIRKRASQARTKADYLAIFSKYSATFSQIYLPRPRPISLEQTLRDILPELFLINNTLYGGGDENNGLENIFEVLDTHIMKFASAQEERVRAVSALLQACARTISGGDSYFVVHSLLGNPSMIIRPAEARGHPIEISVSEQNASHFLITVFSAFSFHHVDDVENFEVSDGIGGVGSMTPDPLLRVKTHHIQEFDFSSGKSTRWLRIHSDGVKEDGSAGSANSSSSSNSSSNGTGRLNGLRGPWGKYREGAETRIGALLDALS